MAPREAPRAEPSAGAGRVGPTRAKGTPTWARGAAQQVRAWAPPGCRGAVRRAARKRPSAATHPTQRWQGGGERVATLRGVHTAPCMLHRAGGICSTCACSGRARELGGSFASLEFCATATPSPPLLSAPRRTPHALGKASSVGAIGSRRFGACREQAGRRTHFEQVRSVRLCTDRRSRRPLRPACTLRGARSRRVLARRRICRQG